MNNCECGLSPRVVGDGVIMVACECGCEGRPQSSTELAVKAWDEGAIYKRIKDA